MFVVNGQTAAPKVCWDSVWFNSSAPSATNRSEYETQPASVLNSICSTRTVIAARCKDEKGEPFYAVKNDTVNRYIATCTVVSGLICNPYNNTNAVCADFQIQYGCTCQTTPSNSKVTTTLEQTQSESEASPAYRENGGFSLSFGFLGFLMEAVVVLMF